MSQIIEIIGGNPPKKRKTANLEQESNPVSVSDPVTRPEAENPAPAAKMSRNYSESKFKCPKCGTKTSDLPTLRNHLRHKHSSLRFRCGVCAKDFKQRRPAVIHQKTVHGAESEILEVGQPAGDELEDLQSLDPTPYACDQCPGRFCQPRALRAHMEKVHLANEPIVCPEAECGVTVLRKELHRHRIDVHPTAAKPHMCEICGARFATLHVVQQHHAYSHSEERPFACPHCPKTFKGRYEMVSHSRMHLGKPFQCQECGSDFSKFSQLEKHKACCPPPMEGEEGAGEGENQE